MILFKHLFNDIIADELFKPFVHKEMKNYRSNTIKSSYRKESETEVAKDFAEPKS
jgi:hypothetical protein